MMTTFNGTEKIGDIVTNFPGASNLFKEYSIDFCCGGGRSLLEVLRLQGTNEESFIEQLNLSYLEVHRNKDRSVDWREKSSSELMDYVVNTHHAYLQKELPLLSEFTTKILRVHGPAQGDVLARLHRLFHQMKMELEQHLIAEEEVLFPLIRQYEESPSGALLEKTVKAINELEADHSGVGDILKEMREITNQYELPAEACRTYTLTFQKLEELESDLFEHIHLENNILFPRMAEGL
ncbi:MAG TPA: iron-sulfur cluster repair di-iron protein [Candidatus Udaeobacter sp.]|nr:iron-sulfur cluster repair di-iron protein [Candidatus Udaeobacter sp.]